MDESSNSDEASCVKTNEEESLQEHGPCDRLFQSDDSDPDASDAAPSLDIETAPHLEPKNSSPKSNSPPSPKDRLEPPALLPKTSLSPLSHCPFPTRRLSPSRLRFNQRRRLSLHKMRRPRRVMEDFVMYGGQDATSAARPDSAATTMVTSPRRLNDNSLCQVRLSIFASFTIIHRILNIFIDFQLAASMTAAAKLKRKVVAVAEPSKPLVEDSPTSLSKLTLSLDLEASPRRPADCAPAAAPRKRALSAEMVQTLDRLADILLTECRTSPSPGVKDAERSTDATETPQCWGPGE